MDLPTYTNIWRIEKGSTNFTTFGIDNYLQDALVYESADGTCRKVVD